MQPRSEPLLWLQCLALGAIPLELLLIRLVLAGADPGPVPGVERFLIWGVGVLAPAVALWRRPADWGSLLLVRQPLASRNSDQLRISASHGGLSSRVAVVITAVILLPMLWWLDDSAVLASEFSPVSGQSRLVTLLLVSPLLALMVWQVQQLVQAATQLLASGATAAPTDSAFRADAVATQRTSLGLQLLNLPALEWPEPAVMPSKQGAEEAMNVEVAEPETDDSIGQASAENEEQEDESPAIQETPAETSDDAEAEALEPVDAGAQAEEESSADAEGIDLTSDQGPEEAMNVKDTEPDTDDSTGQANTEETSTENVSKDDVSKNEDPDEERSAINPVPAEVSDEAEAEAQAPIDAEAQNDASEDIGADDADGDEEQNAKPTAPSESTVAAAASIPVEPEQPGEEQESTALDPEIRQVDSAAGGSTKNHREQAESSGGEESEPDQPSEPTPRGL